MNKKFTLITRNILLYLFIQILLGGIYTIIYFICSTFIDCKFITYLISIIGFIFINIAFYFVPINKIDKKLAKIEMVILFALLTLISIILLLVSSELTEILLFCMQQLLVFDTLFSTDNIILYILIFTIENLIKCYLIYKNSIS